MSETDVVVADVKAIRTRAGNTRFVVVAADGREFSTFREEIASELPAFKGSRARLTYHEERRGSFTNVYLDDIAPLDAPESPPATDPDEAAWQTAVEAAPYLLSDAEREREMPPEELFDRLRPFKELVADDIAGPDEADDETR